MPWAWAQPLPFSALAISGPLSSASLHRCIHQTCSGLTLPPRSVSPISSSSVSLFLLPGVLSPLPRLEGRETKENRNSFFILSSLRKKQNRSPHSWEMERLLGGLCLGWCGAGGFLLGYAVWVWTKGSKQDTELKTGFLNQIQADVFLVTPPMGFPWQGEGGLHISHPGAAAGSGFPCF